MLLKRKFLIDLLTYDIGEGGSVAEHSALWLQSYIY